MRGRLLLATLGLLFVWLASLGAMDSILLSPRDEINHAEVFIRPARNKEPTAVVVLCPGQNGSAEAWLRQWDWQAFADRNHLALAGLYFQSGDEDLKNGKGYFVASRGSGMLLNDALSQAGLGRMPIFLYGFSGGAHFAASYAAWRPEKVFGFCAYSFGWWKAPPIALSSPALIACGQADGIRYGSTFAYFQAGRRQGKPWVWVSLEGTSHVPSGGLDHFVRRYVECLLGSRLEPLVVDNLTFRSRLTDDSDGLVAYADQHQLALLTWNTATLWTTGKSYNQMNRRTLQQQDGDFDTMAQVWKTGVGKICREFALPEEGFLLYGFSRGAHWSGRLALRLPEKFLAVFIHVANSYGKPKSSAGRPLWLVSSGDLDRGRDNAIAFYRECLKKGFPIVLKVHNGLGHAENDKSRQLRAAFFDYALRIRDQARQAGRTPDEIMREALETSDLTGDLLSQEVARGEDFTKIPEAQRVKLPDEAFASAWGFLRK